MIQFTGILLAMFSIMSMQLILAAILPDITMQLGGAQLYGFIFSGYMIASIITIPLFSKLADVYGKRLFFIIGISIFIIGSLLGGVAYSMQQLIAARLIQGAAAGIITPVTLAMVSDMFEPEQRGIMIGRLSIVQVVANVASPLLGQAITSYFSWQYAFYFSIVLLGTALLIILLGKKPRKEKVQIKFVDIDIWGSVLFGIIAASIVYFLNSYIENFQLNIVFVLLCLLIIGGSIALFFVEKRHTNPVIRLEFFINPLLRRSLISAMLSGAIMYGFVNLLPIITAVGQIKSSLLLLIFMLSATLGMIAGGRLWKKINRLSMLMWAFLVSGLGIGLASVSLQILNLMLLAILICGICVGTIMATLLIHSQNSVSSNDRTVLSGLVQLSRYFARP